MSLQNSQVLSLIVSERFGPIVEKVAMFLFHCGPLPILYIKMNTGLPLSKIRESLCILIKYRLVSFKPNQNEKVAVYHLEAERVYLMLRFPKYTNLIKKRFGDESEMIIEEVLQRGYWTGSELILKVIERQKKDHDRNISIVQMREKLISLIMAQYLQRQYRPEEDQPVPVTPENFDPGAFQHPDLDVTAISLVQSGRKTVASLPDRQVYWVVNFDRFHQDFRDKAVVSAFSKRIDEDAGEFVRLLLQQMYIRTQAWAEVSNPVPVIEIRDIVRKQTTHQHLLAFFDQYVTVLEQDSANLIRKSGDAGGGSIQIYLKETFTHLAWEVVEQMVLEKFNNKAARIFRAVKMKQLAESEIIQNLAKIKPKETKSLLYRLLDARFLEVQELKKAANNSFVLFYIDLDKVVRMILELCYKTLFNIMTRKSHDKSTNRRLIDKKQRVDTIVMGMKAQNAEQSQLDDIEDMITPPEREILNKVEMTMNKLDTVELEIDDTIFLLEMYLKYN